MTSWLRGAVFSGADDGRRRTNGDTQDYYDTPPLAGKQTRMIKILDRVNFESDSATR